WCVYLLSWVIALGLLLHVFASCLCDCSRIARRRRATMMVVCVPTFFVIALVSAVISLTAHHSWPVSNDRLVTVKGTVIEFLWANPHPMITLEVQTTDGRTEKWQVGGPATNRMEANGWTKTTLKPGDVITGIGYQFADGQKIV